jgi:imidazolonepropionase
MTVKLIHIGQLVTYNSTSRRVETTSSQELLVENGVIVEIGDSVGPAEEVIDCGGRLVTPGFVDPHTHPVFFDGREEEYALRLAGVSYQEIAARGGGIRASIAGVRQASEDDLVLRVKQRLDRFLKLGTTTIEAKSGYGLDTESELKSLRVLARVNQQHAVDIVPTFLGAHAFPPEYADDHDGYVDLICREMIPAVAEQGIARYCDVFCEAGYFDVAQARKILVTARDHGLLLRLHADEFADSGAAALAAELKAASADHLMAVSDAGIQALAAAGVTATLLPGTTFFLGSHTYAPARKMAEAGIPLALATDFNPGSSHLQSMSLMISLAGLYLGMSVEAAFLAATYQAAVTIGMAGRVGSLEVGKQADLIIWDLERLIEIPYYCTDVPIHWVMKAGKWVKE